MAIQLNVPYKFVGPDGTIAVLNDRTDPDYVGIVSAISGLESPEIRENADNIVEGDGGVHGSFYMGRRPFSFEGFIMGDLPATRNARMNKLERATRALRGDGTMTWTEDGRAKTRLLYRRASPIRFGSLLPKTFQIGLVSANPLIESDALNTIFDAAAPLSIVVNNAGTATAPVLLKVTGAATSPITITNNTTTEVVKLNSALAGAGNTRIVDTSQLARTVVDELAANKYAELDFLGTTWINLAPGANTIVSDKGTRLDAWWRDAWL